tara:strand:+ start:1223 stop:1477 length:255 start_codon:yes stop_codon:yes gene_type:complete
MQLKLSKNFLSVQNDDSLILLNLDSGKYLEANNTGKIILDLIALGKNKEEILKILEIDFQCSSEQLLSDFEFFLKELKTKGILE